MDKIVVMWWMEDSMDEALWLSKRCARQSKHTPASQSRAHVMKPIGLHFELQAQEQLDHHRPKNDYNNNVQLLHCYFDLG